MERKEPVIPVVPKLPTIPDPQKDPVGYDLFFLNQELGGLGNSVKLNVPLTREEAAWASKEMEKGTAGFEAYDNAVLSILKRRKEVQSASVHGRTKLSQF